MLTKPTTLAIGDLSLPPKIDANRSDDGSPPPKIEQPKPTNSLSLFRRVLVDLERSRPFSTRSRLDPVKFQLNLAKCF